jgi:hypothetical protein
MDADQVTMSHRAWERLVDELSELRTLEAEVKADA